MTRRVPVELDPIDPIEELASFAHGLGAAVIAQDAARTAQRLTRMQPPAAARAREAACQTLVERLHRYLAEHERALTSSRGRSDQRIQLLQRSAAVIDQLVRERHDSSSDRERVAAVLRARRTKFLMATTADALATFGARLDATTSAKTLLRRTAAHVAYEVAAVAVARWSDAVHGELGALVRRMNEQYLDRLVTDAAEHHQVRTDDDELPIAPRSLVRIVHTPQPVAAPLRGSWLADLLRPEARVRRHAEALGIDLLRELLDAHSQQVVRDGLRFFDDARRVLAASLTRSLDEVTTIARAAADRAEVHRARGTLDGALQATRHAIRELAELVVALTLVPRSGIETS